MTIQACPEKKSVMMSKGAVFCVNFTANQPALSV